MLKHPPQLDLDTLNRDLATQDATASVRWAVDTFGDGLILTSSFGIQAAVMLHLVTRIKPDIPVVVLDTGYLFPETYQFMEQLADRLSLNLKIYSPTITPARLESTRGRLWETADGIDEYHRITKNEPMQRAIRELGATAWFAGLRARQTNHRASLRIIEKQDDIHKIHPILDWSERDIHQYLKAHDLPYHPLRDQNYLSVGDTHSSRPITAGDIDERATRFGGLKQECGLHLPTTRAEDDSRMSADL